MYSQRTVLEDMWLRLPYVVDGFGTKHYPDTISTLFRHGDEVEVRRTPTGLELEGYGMREVWHPLAAVEQEAA